MTVKLSTYSSKHGPIPEDWFENDAMPDPELRVWSKQQNEKLATEAAEKLKAEAEQKPDDVEPT